MKRRGWRKKKLEFMSERPSFRSKWGVVVYSWDRQAWYCHGTGGVSWNSLWADLSFETAREAMIFAEDPDNRRKCEHRE